MTGSFNDPTYGRRNRIVALVLVSVIVVTAALVWLFFDATVALIAAFVTAFVMFGAYWWPGSMWPVPNLWDRLREYERRDDRQ